MIITAVPTPVLKDAQEKKKNSSSISHSAALASEKSWHAVSKWCVLQLLVISQVAKCITLAENGSILMTKLKSSVKMENF